MPLPEQIAALEEISRLSQLTLAELRQQLPAPPASNVRRVSTPSALIDALVAGGEIVLAPGEYTGNFIIGTNGTVLRTEAPDAAHVRCGDPFTPTIDVRASNVMIDGPRIHNGAPDRDCVVIGRWDATSVVDQPDNVVLQNTRIIAGADGGHRGIALQGRSTIIRRCRVENFFEIGRESQAIGGWNGPGPYLIEDNFLEASGENVMFGGAECRIPNMNPTGITIRRNVLFKPQAWKGTPITVKNSFELKAGVDVVFEENTIDGSWANAQIGTPIVLTPRGGTTMPWARVDNVVIRKNSIVNCSDGYSVNIMGSDDLGVSQPVTAVTIEGNLFRDNSSGVLVHRAAALRLMVSRNTFPGITQHFIASDGPALPRFDFLENVVKAGLYGVHRPDATVGLKSWLACRADGMFLDNVIEQRADFALAFPGGNRVVTAAEFAAMFGPDHHLLDGSAGW